MKANKLTVLFMAIVVSLTTIFSSVYLAEEVQHEETHHNTDSCKDEKCSVCEHIQVSFDNLNSLFASSVFVVEIVNEVDYKYINGDLFDINRIARTLVSLKVKLSN